MYAVALASLLLDQVAVFVVSTTFTERITHDERWFSLVEQPVSSLVAIILVLLLQKRYSRLGLGIVLGAALSNLVTFWTRSGAVDYITLPGGVSTNLADILISIGLVITATLAVIRKNPYSNERSSELS